MLRTLATSVSALRRQRRCVLSSAAYFMAIGSSTVCIAFDISHFELRYNWHQKRMRCTVLSTYIHITFVIFIPFHPKFIVPKKMDYHTLTRDDLIDECKNLSRQLAEFKQTDDALQQVTYELRLAKQREAHLNQEIEALSSEQSNTSLLEPFQKQVSDLQRQLTAAKERIVDVEADCEQLRQDNAELLQKQNEVVVAAPPVEVQPSLNEETRLYMESLEAKLDELLAEKEVYEQQHSDLSRSLAECKERVEQWQERCQCAEENLEAKRGEIDEMRELIDALEGKTTAMSAELASYKSEAADPSMY